MNLKKSFIIYVGYIFSLIMFNLNVNADSHADKLDRIESQVQDALIKINRMEKENKDVPSIKVGPGLKFKSGKNEVGSANISKIYIEVSENNHPAIKFYEKNNFVFFKFRHNYYSINNKKLNAMCFSKDL